MRASYALHRTAPSVEGGTVQQPVAEDRPGAQWSPADVRTLRFLTKQGDKQLRRLAQSPKLFCFPHMTVSGRKWCTFP